MREMSGARKPSAHRLIQPLVLGGFLFGLGVWVGASLFPVIETKIVDKPREVQVEKVKYVQIPSIQVPEPRESAGVPAGYSEEWVSAWSSVTKGLSSAQVLRLLGEPLRIRRGGVDEWYYLAETQYGCVYFFNDQVIYWNGP